MIVVELERWERQETHRAPAPKSSVNQQRLARATVQQSRERAYRFHLTSDSVTDTVPSNSEMSDHLQVLRSRSPAGG